MTKFPKSLKETGSSKKSDEDKPDVTTDEKERVDVLDLFQLELTNTLSLPRLLIVQRISEYTKYTEQIELWNLSVLVNQPLSDPELNERINECHNDLVGHHGVYRTMELVKTSPRIKQALESKGTVILHLRQKIKKFIQSCPCCQKMCMDKLRSKAKAFTSSTHHPMQTLMINSIKNRTHPIPPMQNAS